MKLTCPDCQKPVPAEDVNIKLGVGKCLACDAVFSLADQMGQPLKSLRSNLPVAPPKHYRVEDFGPDLTIGWRWYTHAIWFLVFFAIFWDGFLIVWYSIAITALVHGNGGDAGTWIMLIFPMLHLLVGLGLTYVCLITFFNRTEIKLAGGELSVHLGPFPVWGNRRLPTVEVCQLFCTEQCHRRKHGSSYSYNVNALLQSGERISLVCNIQEAHEALYLERVLEERLKLADQRVPGDWVG